MIVDTDILVEMLRSEVDFRMERWMNAQPIQPATTAVSISEILAGVNMVEDRYRRITLQTVVRKVTEENFGYRVIPFDEGAAQMYGQLAERFSLENEVHVLDLQIAAIALSRRKTLATKKTELFERLGVDVSNPFGEKAAQASS